MVDASKQYTAHNNTVQHYTQLSLHLSLSTSLSLSLSIYICILLTLTLHISLTRTLVLQVYISLLEHHVPPHQQLDQPRQTPGLGPLKPDS